MTDPPGHSAHEDYSYKTVKTITVTDPPDLGVKTVIGRRHLK